MSTRTFRRILAPLAVSLSVLVAVGAAVASGYDWSAAKARRPCTLVKAERAAKMAGHQVSSRYQAPLGPTCLYGFKGTKLTVTLVVEHESFPKATADMRISSKHAIRGLRSWCGTLGSQMVVTALPRGSVLVVTAPCKIARRFAAQALKSLRA